MPSRKGRRALANNPNNLNKFYPTCLRQEADLALRGCLTLVVRQPRCENGG